MRGGFFTIGGAPCGAPPLFTNRRPSGRLLPVPKAPILGRRCPLISDFDRAFDVFFQKARSPAPHNPRFRPCPCRFFPKGTVGHALCLAISTVLPPFFLKRHDIRYRGGVQFAKKEADPCGSASVICHYGRWPCRPPSTSDIRGIAGCDCDCNLAPSAAYRKMIASRSGPTET